MDGFLYLVIGVHGILTVPHADKRLLNTCRTGPPAEYLTPIAIQAKEHWDTAAAVGKVLVHEPQVFIPENDAQIYVSDLGHFIEEGKSLRGVAAPSLGDDQPGKALRYAGKLFAQINRQLEVLVPAVHPVFVQTAVGREFLALFRTGGFIF